MSDKPGDPGLLHRLIMGVSTLLLACVCLGAVMYGSNAAFDWATKRFDGSCLVLDSGAELCIKRDNPSLSTQ